MLRCSIKPVILHRNKTTSPPQFRIDSFIDLFRSTPMVVNLFNKALETPQTLPEPLIKTNKLVVENLEKLMVFQMNALKSYLDIGLNQMRAAAEITDLQSMQDFCKRQAEIAQTVQQKLMNDAKAMSDLATRFKTEMDGLAKSTLEDVLPKAA
jgi:phasin family protein